jgi:hypothetical protein
LSSTVNETFPSVILLAQAQTVIECRNCGGNGGPGLQGWISLGALFVAAVALYFNAVQHREFLRSVKAHARFAIKFNVLAPRVFTSPDDCATTTSREPLIVIQVSFFNSGERAEPTALLNVLAPASVTQFFWAQPDGSPLRGEQGYATATPHPQTGFVKSTAVISTP